MKHASARNVIERTFRLLNICCKILASPSFYSINTQQCIINACCLLHSFIRREMANDPTEEEIDTTYFDENIDDDIDNIVAVQPTDEWTQFRREMVIDMFNTWQSC